MRYKYELLQYDSSAHEEPRGPPEADKGWTGILTDYEMDQFSNEISVGNEMTLTGFLSDSECSTSQYWNSVMFRI